MSASDLEAFHRPRLEVLTAAGTDVLACETLPALAEVEALVRALPGLGVPAWLSLTTVVDAEGVVRTRLGEPAAEAFAMARDSDQVLAVGVNCLDPADVLPAVREAAQVAGKPVVVYPNSGETWNAATRSWNGDADLRLEDVSAWLDAGTRLVGGCCRVLPSHVRRVSQLLRPEPGQP
jgi:homocysteine S-methyltransferase